MNSANLSQGTFTGCDFSNAEMKNARFYKSDLSGVKFIGTNLQKSEFIMCYLIATVFKSANLEDASFENNFEIRVELPDKSAS